MAFSDSAVLGGLLGEFLQDKTGCLTLGSVLKVYESVQKPYTTFSVNGAAVNREMYHLPDGEEQKKRDAEFAIMSELSESKWIWVDAAYQRKLIGTDLVETAKKELRRVAEAA
jgi:hypothetical protein